MGAAETIWGQLAAAEGLVRFQLQGTSPNTPIDSVLLYVGSALESHARVQAHYTAAHVAAAAATPASRCPWSQQAHRRAAKGVAGARQQAARPQGGRTSEARCDARHYAIHVHYGIHLCAPFSCEIRVKFV